MGHKRRKPVVLAGRAGVPLALEICEHWSKKLGDGTPVEFTNENVFVQIGENVRGAHVFIVQPFSTPVNTSIMELHIMLDACKRASARRITAVIPYYAYGRSDKKDQPRVPITARLIADHIQVSGAKRVLTMDLHAGQIQGFFKIPVDELTAQYILAKYWLAQHIPNLIVVATDTGFAKKARHFADLLDVPLAIIEKRRKGNDGSGEALSLIGKVDRCNALIVDDEIDTAGSGVRALDLVKKEGAAEAYFSATHGVLSGKAISLLSQADFKRIVVTNTYPVPPEKMLPNMEVVSVAKLFADAMDHIYQGSSVSALFKMPDD